MPSCPTITVRFSLSACMLLLALTLALSPLAMTGCSTNPATGEQQINILSKDQEIQMGEQNAPKMLKEMGGEIPSQTIQKHVADIGQTLAGYSERTDLPWTFYVVDSEVINAFALPGGKIFITRGLIAKMDNDAQLAAVLGHEIGHVTAQHAGQQMTHQLGVGIAVAGASTAAGVALEDEYLAQAAGVGASMVGTGLVLQYSRSHEAQADSLGLRYMTRAGYNPIGMVQLLEILKEASNDPTPPEFLLTHPLPSTRISSVENEIVQDYPQYDQTGKYKMGFDSFKQNVAQPLSQLPPPENKQSKPANSRTQPSTVSQELAHAH